MRIGVLNGGGDAPGLNAVIRGIVRSCAYKYSYQVIGFRDGFKGMIEDNWETMSVKSISGILQKGGTILGTTNRDNPFNFNGKDMSQKIINTFKKHNLSCLIVIGGDGTLSIAEELYRKWELPVIGVPKTIDNDLAATDITFGFHSAVLIATTACDILHNTAESHHRVMILEVMGRTAGWIALYTGLSGGADIILIPEIPYSMESIKKKIEERAVVGKRFSIIVVAEGARAPEGGLVATSKLNGNKVRLGGIGNYLAAEIERLTGIECRATVLGHLQRGCPPIPFDRLLATRFGVKAVELAAKNVFGVMVALHGDVVDKIELKEAVKSIKVVPADHELIGVARAIGISLGDEA